MSHICDTGQIWVNKISRKKEVTSYKMMKHYLLFTILVAQLIIN